MQRMRTPEEMAMPQYELDQMDRDNFDPRLNAKRRIEELEVALTEAGRILTVAYYAGVKLGFARQKPDASLPHEVREFVAEFHGENGGPLHVAARTAKTLLQKSK